MTNAIEFFASEHERLAIPAATTMVFVDGILCEHLEPAEIVHGSWPEFGWAKLVYNPAAQADPQRITAERIEDLFAMGQTVCLRQLHNPIPPEAATAGLPIFTGQIEGMETVIDGRHETLEILVKDCSAALGRITVYGRHILQDDGSTMFFSGLDTTFNPSGQANAAFDPSSSTAATYPIFSVGTAETLPWGCAEAISYLLGAYVPSGALHWPDLDQLRALTEQRPIRDLDVTGLSLLEALQRCCQNAGLQFRFEPNLVETGPSQAIVFYRNGQGRAIELNCQPAGQALGLSRTNIAALRSERAFYPVTHRHIGQGDFKTYEATFELVKAWDPALEDTNYALFCSSTNPQFYELKDVYRKWCLNEAGDYTAAPYSQGEPFDFSKIFEGADHLHRHRRFWPTLSTDRQGKSLGYVLEVSYDDGLHWWTYTYVFENLLDECGIWFSSDQLDVDAWVAALKGFLKVRITASVVSDERLTSVATDGPTESTAPVVDHVITLPRQFRYRKVLPQSLFAQKDPQTLGKPDEVDDSTALDDFVRRQTATALHVIDTTEIHTPTLTLHLHPGDRVTSSPDSRDLLNGRRDNRSLVWIERVQADFRKQCTRLKLVRQRM
jgi:hypothetical protein